jgi:predicted metal-dependent peptidase
MNPFELRFSIFNTAKDLLVNQHEANLAAWEVLNKTTKEAEELAPKFPTTEEIIDKAIEINTFISGNTTKELANIAKRMSGVSVIF